MHTHDPALWAHRHDFAAETAGAEKNTRRVLWLTLGMMLVEIAAGKWWGSMALLADGMHMGTHVAAFAIAAGAYWLARRHAGDERYSFGTGKIGVLAAYTSAVILGGVALYILGDSFARLMHPEPIAFGEAIPIACLGLLVNITSALLLGHDHNHGPSHEHGDGHVHDAHDLNLRSAYVHVLADAATSVLAIAALVAGRAFHVVWLDAACGVVGSLVIGQWSWSLLRDTQTILVDREPDSCDLSEVIRRTLGGYKDTIISDLHIWQAGVNRYCAVISLVTNEPEAPSFYKQLLIEHAELIHVTVEVNQCRAAGVDCRPEMGVLTP